MPASPDHTQAGNDPPSGLGPGEPLAERLAEVLRPSTVVVCVGNELRGDDGAGITIARKLAGTVPWKVLETQTAPENFLMKVVSTEPESVVLVDALDFGAQPGAVELIAPDRLIGQGPSTHGPAPLAFLDVLEMMHPCRRVVLGIQPLRTEFGTPLSEPVERAIDLVVRTFHLLAEFPRRPAKDEPQPGSGGSVPGFREG